MDSSRINWFCHSIPSRIVLKSHLSLSSQLKFSMDSSNHNHHQTIYPFLRLLLMPSICVNSIVSIASIQQQQQQQFSVFSVTQILNLTVHLSSFLLAFQLTLY